MTKPQSSLLETTHTAGVCLDFGGHYVLFLCPLLSSLPDTHSYPLRDRNEIMMKVEGIYNFDPDDPRNIYTGVNKKGCLRTPPSLLYFKNTPFVLMSLNDFRVHLSRKVVYKQLLLQASKS